MKLFKSQQGQALAETAIVIPVFVILLLGMFDLYHVQSANLKGHIRARNEAWKAGANEQSIFDIFKQAGNSGDMENMADMLLQTSHGKADTTLDSLNILPKVSITNNVYVDRNTWSFSIGVTSIKDFFKDGPVGPDELGGAKFEE